MTNYTFTGQFSYDLTNPANYQPNGIPTSSDNLTINPNDGGPVSGSISVNELTPTATQTITGASTKITANTVDNGFYVEGGATLSVNNSVTGAIALAGSTINATANALTFALESVRTF
jgi:hypothetical protein